MQALNRLAALLVLTLLVSVRPASAAPAQQKLVELDNFPFSLALAPQLRAELLPVTDAAGYAAAAVFPHNITEFDVLALRAGKGAPALKLIIGRTTGKFGGPYEAMHTQLAFTAGDDTAKAQLVGGPQALLPGILNRMCVWANGDQGEIIVLFSLANGSDSDGPVYGAAFKGAEAPRLLDMSGARAVFGGFNMADLDGDGRYELIGARNLDGMAGGFNYHAVRAYTGAGYTPLPDGFKPFFQHELAFLNWVVATRDTIQANPDPYLKAKHNNLPGYAYVADFEKESYGFDTLIELPSGTTSKVDIPKYNALRRAAFERVKTYRDELQAWLDGGAHPGTWRMAR